MRVVVHDDDFTLARTDSKLERIKSKMCEWYDVEARGILGSGRREVQEIENLGPNSQMDGARPGVRSGRQASTSAFLRGLGLGEDSKTVNSAAMNSARMRTRRSWEQKNYMSLDRSDVQHPAKEVCRKMINTTQGSCKGLKKAGRDLKGVQKGTWMTLAWESVDVVSVDVHVDLGVGEGSRKKTDERMYDDDERNSGEALVENTGGACAEHGRSRTQRGHHGSGKGARDAIDVRGLGLERASSSLDRLQRCQGDRVKDDNDNDNDNDTLRKVPHLSMRAWPYRQERRGHGPTKKNLSYR